MTLDSLQQRLTGFFADPGYRGEPVNELFGRLAVEAPVLHIGGQWVLSSQQIIKKLGHGTSLSMSKAEFPAAAYEANPDFVDFFANNLFFKPLAEHARLKSLLSAHFVPATIEALATPTKDIARDLLGAAADRGGQIDLVADLAAPMPALVAATLIGVPAGDRAYIADRAAGLLTELRNSFPATGVDPGTPIGAAGFRELRGYFEDLLAGPLPVGSLGARLADAHRAGAIGTDDAVELLMLLLMAGVDTVITGMANAMSVLLDRPAELDRIRRGELDPTAAFTEAIRLFTPVPFARRRVDDGVTIDGVTFGTGQEVLFCLAAGNRDPLVFDDPAQWRPSRGRGGTLSFGHGVYHCIGASLGLLEGAAVLTALAELGPVHRADAAPVWNDNVGFHSPAALLVTR
jgi:cytochrome P450